MKRGTKQWMAMVLSAQTLAAGGAGDALAADAAGKPAQATRLLADRPVSVKPGDLKGKVVNPATKKPWAKVSVELVDPETGKTLQKTRADGKGRYDLGKVDPGRYILRVNGKVDLPVVVSPGATVSTLNVAVPKALMGKIAGGISWATVGLVGAGVATAVAVPVGVSSGGGGGGGGRAASSS